METRQIEYFLSVVEAGSLSAAADKHYISQSSLSKIINSLEKELGVSLFDRSKRNVFLTEAGKVFLEHAYKINMANKAMFADLKGYISGCRFFFHRRHTGDNPVWDYHLHRSIQGGISADRFHFRGNRWLEYPTCVRGAAF